ncbi:MAG: hypothetical protein IKY51_05500 [Alistipes sp.]|nr:hypothetical protein [Alistipes sp.]
MANFTISIESDFHDLWRYNIVVMASVMRDGEQTEVLKHRSEIAPVGAELQMKPLDYNPDRAIHLQSGEADALTLYIYIIPHTLPTEYLIRLAPPFELDVKVKYGTRIAFKHRYMINQWSGENISVSVTPPAKK